ncbi:alpha-galactosidase [Thermosipho globiformans]|uniref:alpha-galactosidase n=1 Tax=Thermosipho globiformans TaxID=380685 RepID=UPI000F8F7DA5|nr:alpha-galactosidase [Thermosipho globiformans]
MFSNFSNGYFYEKKEGYEIKWKVENFSIGWKFSWSIKGKTDLFEVFKIKKTQDLKLFSFFAINSEGLFGFLDAKEGNIEIIEDDENISFVINYEHKLFKDFSCENSFVILKHTNRGYLLKTYKYLIESQLKSKKSQFNMKDVVIFNEDLNFENLNGKVVVFNRNIEDIDKNLIENLKDLNCKIFARSKNYLQDFEYLDGFVVSGPFEENYLFSNIGNFIVLDAKEEFEEEWKVLFDNVKNNKKIVSFTCDDSIYVLEAINEEKRKVKIYLNFERKVSKFVEEDFINLKSRKLIREDGRIFNFYGGDL